MSRPTGPMERDRCDAYRKAYLAAKSRPEDLEAREFLMEATAALKPTLIRGPVCHAGWKFTLDRAGVVHLARMTPSAIMAQQAGKENR